MSSARPIIAVVDDEEPVRRALSRLLRAAGLDARTYSCGGDFLDSLHDHPFDCVVLDVHMPRVSGFDVQESLTRAGANVPVVAITGRDSDETRDRMIAGGAVAYLRKPVDDRALLSAVAEAIARQRAPSPIGPKSNGIGRPSPLP